MSSDLLPANATPAERALSEATARIGEIQTPIRSLWNPQTCPPELLPWLAWALSVDDWRSEWSDQQKRDTIAASYTVHSIKGTIGALRAALGALGYRLEITEWQDTGGQLQPYEFTVDLDVTGAAFVGDVYNSAIKLIDNVKNVRSHLARLRVRHEQSAAVRFGSASAFASYLEVYDAVGDFYPNSGRRVRAEPEPPPPVFTKNVIIALGSVQLNDGTAPNILIYGADQDDEPWLLQEIRIAELANYSSGSSQRAVLGADYSSQTDTIVVLISVSPYVKAYKYSGGQFVEVTIGFDPLKLGNPAAIGAPNNAKLVKFFDAGRVLFIGGEFSLNTLIYDDQAGTYVGSSLFPSGPETGQTTSISTDDEKGIAFITINKVAGLLWIQKTELGAFVPVEATDFVPSYPSNIQRLISHRDGRDFIVSTGVFEFYESEFTNAQNPAVNVDFDNYFFGNGSSYVPTYSKQNNVLFHTGVSSSFMTIPDNQRQALDIAGPQIGSGIGAICSDVNETGTVIVSSGSAGVLGIAYLGDQVVESSRTIILPQHLTSFGLQRLEFAQVLVRSVSTLPGT